MSAKLNKKRLIVSLTERDLAKLDLLKKKHKVTRNRLIEYAVDEFLKSQMEKNT